MGMRRTRKERPPLDAARLEEVAFAYVGRFSTTRSKLRRYLARKLKERGWSGSGDPPVAAIVERFASNGFVDDAAYALAKSRILSARGYGTARLRSGLRAAGVAEEDGTPAIALSESEAAESALRFARRRRIGPYAAHRLEPRERERALAAMVRAGHGFEIARKIVDLLPGSRPDPTEL